MSFERLFGLLCIVFGLFVILFALSELILRVLIASLGLFLINFGLKLRGMPSLYITIIRMWSSRYDF